MKRRLASVRNFAQVKKHLALINLTAPRSHVSKVIYSEEREREKRGRARAVSACARAHTHTVTESCKMFRWRTWFIAGAQHTNKFDLLLYFSFEIFRRKITTAVRATIVTEFLFISILKVRWVRSKHKATFERIFFYPEKNNK